MTSSRVFSTRPGLPARGVLASRRVFLPDMGVNLCQIQLGISAPVNFHDTASLRAAKKASISSSGTKSD